MGNPPSGMYSTLMTIYDYSTVQYLMRVLIFCVGLVGAHCQIWPCSVPCHGKFYGPDIGLAGVPRCARTSSHGTHGGV